jgi:hypothetical protein
LSSLAFHTIDIAVCLRSSAAISIFSRSAFLRFFKNDKPPPRIPTSVAFPSQNPLRIQKYVDMWDPSRFRQITKISQMARFSNSRSGLEDQGSGDYDKTEAGQGNPLINWVTMKPTTQKPEQMQIRPKNMKTSLTTFLHQQ